MTSTYKYGQAYPKMGSCDITDTSNADGYISPSSFKVSAFGVTTYTPLEFVFKFNKYREAKPYVPFLDSIDFSGVSYQSPNAPGPDETQAKYTIKLYLQREF